MKTRVPFIKIDLEKTQRRLVKHLNLTVYKTIYQAVCANYLCRMRRKSLWMSEAYADHMVLQRDTVLKIRGHAKPGSYVRLSFAGHEAETFAGIDGRWCCLLPSMEAGGAYRMEVWSGRHRLVFRDVMVGEVWLVAGSSLMEMFLGGDSAWKEEQRCWQEQDGKGKQVFPLRFQNKLLAGKCYHQVFPITLCRLFNRYEIGRPPRWVVADAGNVGGVSAHAYYFARKLSGELNVPVGLICRAISGAGVESFVDRELLMDRMPNVFQGLLKPFISEEGFNARIKINFILSPYRNQKHFLDPGFMFETAIRSLDAYPIRGALYGIYPFLKGESAPYQYALYRMLIDSWRRQWGASFPVYFLQFGRWEAEGLSLLRDTMRRGVESLPGCGMVVGYDTIKPAEKDPIHPKERRQVGERFARMALYNDYGRKDIIPSGPVFREAQLRADGVYILFDWSDGLHTSDGDVVREFELAGADGQFVPVRASIADRQVVLSCPASLPVPLYVRYAWADHTTANLVNGEGLPVSTFNVKMQFVDL